MIRINRFDVLRRPLITEKSTTVSENNVYAFEVDISSSKKTISEAIEEIFGVNVLSVNTSILKGKTKRFKGKLGQRKNIKKAFVRIQDGQNLDLSIAI